MMLEVPAQVAVLDAVRNLGHLTMTYRCESCGYEVEVWCALGVEGPLALKDAGRYVAAPFGVPCPAWPIRADATEEERKTYRHLGRCDGMMSHVEWSRDREVEPSLIPDEAPRFVVDPDADCGRLVYTEGALVSARRWHNERT